MLCNSSDDLDTLYYSGCISELEAVGCKPILPPDLKVKMSVTLQWCDTNQREEGIKNEVEKQSGCVKVQDVSKSFPKNIQVTFRANTWPHRYSQRDSYCLIFHTKHTTSAWKFSSKFYYLLQMLPAWRSPHIVMPKVKGL